MRVSVAIPVRLESRRLPSKPLAEVCGRPLLWHVWHNLVGSCAGDTVVVTDSPEIADRVAAWGGQAILRAGRFRNGTERIAAVLAELEGDHIVNVQCDEVFFTAADLDRFVTDWQRSGAELVTPVYHIDDDADLADTNIVKVTTGADGEALSFSRTAPPGSPALGHVGVYGYAREMLGLYAGLLPSEGEIEERLEQLRFHENGYRFTTCDIGHPRMAVNTPDDLARLRVRMGESATR